MTIKFGTDGWRGIIAEDFTFEKVRLCAQGVSNLLAMHGDTEKGLVVGYDTRFGSRNFANAVAEVAASNGIKTFLADRPAPTPVLSYNLVAKGASAGAIITASHNSREWNGFKYKPAYGGTASSELTVELEQHIEQAEKTGFRKTLSLSSAEKIGLVSLFDPEPLYLENLGTLVDIEGIRKAGLHVAVDSMHGAGAGYFSKILDGGKTKVTELRAENNPLFPGMKQPEPLSPNLSDLINLVSNSNIDVGLATDGDADRLGVIDEHGQFVTTLQTFALLCLYQLDILKQKGPIVRSITMTTMINKLGESYGVPVFQTPVGFKYLCPVMIQEKALAAGEESGGYAFRGNIPERDGILSGLLVLDMMVKTGKTVSQLLQMLVSKVGPHHYARIDLHFDKSRHEIEEKVRSAKPNSLADRPVECIDDIDGYHYTLTGGYWALIRFSGPETLLRIYAEARSPQEVETILSELKSITGI